MPRHRPCETNQEVEATRCETGLRKGGLQQKQKQQTLRVCAPGKRGRAQLSAYAGTPRACSHSSHGFPALPSPPPPHLYSLLPHNGGERLSEPSVLGASKSVRRGAHNGF